MIYEYPKLYVTQHNTPYTNHHPTNRNPPTTSISTVVKLLRASKPLNIPIYVSTQNRARLGNTVSELTPYLESSSNPNVRIDFDKTLFSMATPELKALLPDPATAGPLDVILIGIESHVCVTQTALDMLALGHRVYVVADGVSSSHVEERNIALARLRDAGAIVTSSEGVLFEVMADAKREGFRDVSKLVKETSKDTGAALEAFCAASKI